MTRKFVAPARRLVYTCAMWGAKMEIQLKGEKRGMGKAMSQRFAQVNKELWILLSVFAVTAALNFLVAPHHLVVGLYAFPTLFSAYYYGRKHATLTAVASVLVVILLMYSNPLLFARPGGASLSADRWYETMLWAGILVITAYAMGTLYERKEAKVNELRETYNGILQILQKFTSNDKYTQNHSYRVSIYAAKIAAQLGFDSERVEDVRAAAMLHDIGKLDIGREILYKAARLTEQEFAAMQEHGEMGIKTLGLVGGSLRRVIPIVLAHHDKIDGSDNNPVQGEKIPIESRILTVADRYDTMTSDRPYRKAMSLSDARDIIVKGSGTDFDPKVVEAFLEEFRRGEMEVPEVLV